ncbi:hypothetical protein J4401_04020 [Candidatus Woesearchaeota archaeon]|nr:hypothetical protein [Candidatus Woesearchaeota archaeon]
MDKMPVYVKLDDDSSVRNLIPDLLGLIASAKATIQKIKDLSKEEESKAEQWKANSETILAKLDIAKAGLEGPGAI